MFTYPSPRDLCREERREKREEGRGKREVGRGKREEGRGKREEGRGKREEREREREAVREKPLVQQLLDLTAPIGKLGSRSTVPSDYSVL